MSALPWDGGCRCGAVRFRISAPPLLASICHCRGCQRMTGGAFSTTYSVPTGAFQVTAGEPVLGGVHGPVARHHHCDACKSWVFTRVEPDPGFVNVRATLLDDPSGFEPFLECYAEAKLPWVQVDAQRSYDEFPTYEEYPALIAEYQAISIKG